MPGKTPLRGNKMNTSTFFEGLVHEDRVHRTIYTDAAIFEREMTHVFGAVWVYLAHVSQIPNNDDFVTARLGLRPLIVARDSDGRVRALYNRCTHRGARICRQDRGNARTFQCAYHGWLLEIAGIALRPRHAQHGRPFAERLPGRHPKADR